MWGCFCDPIGASQDTAKVKAGKSQTDFGQVCGVLGRNVECQVGLVLLDGAET